MRLPQGLGAGRAGKGMRASVTGGADPPALRSRAPPPAPRPPVFEANVLYALRFMVDTGMGGGSWVELPAGSWRRVPQEQVRGEGARVRTAARRWRVPSELRWALGMHTLLPTAPRPTLPSQAATYCQIEAHVCWDKIIVHAPEGAPALC